MKASGRGAVERGEQGNGSDGGESVKGKKKALKGIPSSEKRGSGPGGV